MEDKYWEELMKMKDSINLTQQSVIEIKTVLTGEGGLVERIKCIENKPSKNRIVWQSWITIIIAITAIIISILR
jgi:hypothetical protein